MVIIIDTHFLKCYYGFGNVETRKNDILKTTKGEGTIAWLNLLETLEAEGYILSGLQMDAASWTA